ncbi:MAG: leucine--tRNA ligase [Bacteroidia bacterium]
MQQEAAMEYDFRKVEKYWQDYWAKNHTFRATAEADKPSYYVLDMFPYPSGAGLHVGHPLGYIASDILARYKRLQGFSVLHPMGFDSFGLPAEQYAIQTGQHPKVTTEQNIARYRDQLDKIGFSFDWDREVRTSDPSYYKWTQWIFIQIYHSWYNIRTNKAEPVQGLITAFEKNGNTDIEAVKGDTDEGSFTAAEWKSFSEKRQQEILMNYRLAYLSEAWVNWCPKLGTVLANDEVKEGVSERGGYPVERKRMPQWSMRITAYAQRLLEGLDTIDWTESIKESQRNWIGRSEGSSLKFDVSTLAQTIEVFTTRPDTVFGVSFLTLAPEHELVDKITTAGRKKEVDEYVTFAKNRSERERQADVKKITGVFTGAYAEHPFTRALIPIWIGDYVLAGYGTGAVMAVPAHDSRDYAFATHFGLDKPKVIDPGTELPEGESYDGKEGILVNSDFLNGLQVKEAVKKIIEEIEKRGLGKGKINYRLRDAAFGRQRYWGEPIPVYYKDGVPYTVAENDLPVVLPEIDKFQPTETGEPPLGRAKDWKYTPPPLTPPLGGGEPASYPLELTTMPGWAGSSWYYLRYMDPGNDIEFASKEAITYWKNVDLYLGGSEHATGHLLYVRFWTKFLADLGYLPFQEPAKKLINQGMIQGVSRFASEIRVHHDVKEKFDLIDKKLIIKQGDVIILTLDIPQRDNSTGYNIYCSNGMDLKYRFAFLNSENGEEIPTVIDHGRVNIEFVKEISINSETYHVIDINKWLEKEEKYNPIIISDFPMPAFWHYSNKIWRDFNGNDIRTTQFNEEWTVRPEVEKMSKSKYNVVTPDLICDQYGADCLRLYEMFLGPLEQSKPWNTNGITGVSNFIRRLWRLYHTDTGFSVSDEAATKAELKVLHRTIKKVMDDIDRFSFNTSVSSFMICVNDLMDLKCNKKAILEPLAVLVAPYAPHVAEELWKLLGHKESITYAKFPVYDEKFLVETAFKYPVSFNGKTRFFLELDLSLSKEDVEKEVLAQDETKKQLDGKAPKKVIVVPNKIVNIVV